MDNDKIIEQAMAIVESYDKGMGSYNGKLKPFKWFECDYSWIMAIGLFELSKMDYEVISELHRMNAVSIKHATLLAKQSTGKHDFTNLFERCPFVHSIDNNLQSFRFKRESKNLKVDLSLLESQLELLDLELIIEEQDTRSGGKVTSYFYDVKPDSTKGE